MALSLLVSPSFSGPCVLHALTLSGGRFILLSGGSRCMCIIETGKAGGLKELFDKDGFFLRLFLSRLFVS